MTCIYITTTGGLAQPFSTDFARFFRVFPKSQCIITHNNAQLCTMMHLCKKFQKRLLLCSDLFPQFPASDSMSEKFEQFYNAYLKKYDMEIRDVDISNFSHNFVHK